MMTKDEISLLLYLESRATDHGGLVNASKMNKIDYENAKRWNDEGYIDFGRILFDLIPMKHLTNYVRLSSKAWSDAHSLRIDRACRNMHELTLTNGGRDG